jgi:thioredoxin-dependent peroxiredoxin
VILGVSPDTVESHAKWKPKLGIPHPLLADSNHEVAQRYGVWVEKTMAGRTYWGVARTTFVIDEQGTIAKIFPKVQVQGHSAEVLSILRSMS